MNSFLNPERPILTQMLHSDTPDGLLDEIARGTAQGTDAFCLQMEKIKWEYRTDEVYTRLFRAMGDKPAYITCYQRGNSCPHPQTDAELAEELIRALKCGGKLVDIRGDMFAPSAGEITTNPDAVAQQEALIARVHELGGEVLMSSHVLKYIPKEQVLSIALLQQQRGVDIAKVVTAADTETELQENFEATLLLAQKMAVPTLFVCNGAVCRRHRRFAPTLTAKPTVFLVVENARTNENQPTIATAKTVLDYAYHPIVSCKSDSCNKN